MMKVVITIYGHDIDDLSFAADHAANQLSLGTPSENCAWEDGSRVEYTVEQDVDAEYKEIYGDGS